MISFGLTGLRKAHYVCLGTLLAAPIASQAQSVGPASPATVFVVSGDTSTAMRKVASVVDFMGYTTALRSPGFLTTGRKLLTTCVGDATQVRISASVLQASPVSSVVVLWGIAETSAKGAESQGYIVYDHADVPSGGCAWEALAAIRTAVVHASDGAPR